MKGERKQMHTIEYRTMYENEVNKQYHSLKEIYEEIQLKLKELSEKNPDLYNEIEDLSIEEEFNFVINGNEFEISNFDKKEFIEEMLCEYHFLKSDSLSKLFKVRKRMLDKRNDKLTSENYRTALSMTSEFYNDIYIDILKNKLTFIEKDKNGFKNKSNYNSIGLELYKKNQPTGNYEYFFNKNFSKE